jgi:hypothetical protein
VAVIQVRQLSGKNAQVVCNGANVAVKEWTCQLTVAESDVTNTETQGYTDVETNAIGIEFDGVADFDADHNPLDAPRGLVPGQNVTNVQIYLNGIGGSPITMAKAKVLPSTIKASVKEMIGFTFKLKNKGSFSLPTGVIS